MADEEEEEEEQDDDDDEMRRGSGKRRTIGYPWGHVQCRVCVKREENGGYQCMCSDMLSS